ncbi:lactonase family protein [Chitinophaga solisilvae]|uniref:lactonase family protein n=1 Tax=Chitinophaga solisilvae TaxID=1233460 RepID=UPI00136B8A19|nr:lactonase family protein [Chitinophaga solisilvae]
MKKLRHLFWLFLMYSSMAQAQNYLFIGSYNWNKEKEGIYVYRFDTATGGLQFVSSLRDVLNPGYLALSPDGRYVYACTEARTPGDGGMSSFAFDSVRGALTFISRQPAGSENPVYTAVHKSGKWLINACYTGGSAAVFPLSDKGVIGPAAQVFLFRDSSLTERQRSSHVHSSVFSLDHHQVLLPDLGADKIRCFTFTDSSSRPLQAAAAPFIRTVPGSGPRHITIHPNQRFVYCIEEMSGNVVAYTYHNGQLQAQQTIRAHFRKEGSDFNSADIHLSPDGRFLYASTRDPENIIVIFRVNSASGRLTSIGRQPSGGSHPRNFVIDPSGKYLLAANQLSGNVVVFRRNMRTGRLRKTGISIQAPGASCLQLRSYHVTR